MHEHEHNHCHCDHCHSHGEEVFDVKGLIILSVGALLLIVSFIPIRALADFPRDVLRIICAVLCCYPIVISAYKSVREMEIDEGVLLVIAVVAAFCIREFAEAAAVSLFFRVGEYLEEYASRRSVKSIEEIFSIVSDSGHIVREEGGFEEIDADDIETGMKLAVLPHEIIPVDGVVLSGSGSVDTSAITGESIPVEVAEGSKLISGCINGDSTIIYEATATKENSGAARIVEMVEEATAKKSKSQDAIAKFAKYYTPAVVAAAVIVAVIPSIITRRPSEWIYRALVLLVSSCPCSVVLSVPLAFLTTIGASAKRGMIIKGSNFIEALASADTVLFDKTGTLTDGTPVAGEVYTSGDADEGYLLELAAKCEYYSTHPLGAAVRERAGEADMNGVFGFEEIAGGGTAVNVPEGRVLCGGRRLMERENIDISSLPEVPVYVVLNGKAVGGIDILNTPRDSAKKAVNDLEKLGMKKIAVLTGDTEKRTEYICGETGIKEYRCNLLPENKMTALEEFKSGSSGVVYIGDGINDAPVLAASDAGIAMGLGTRAAAEAADIILTDGELTHLGEAIHRSRKAMSTVKGNIIFSLVVKLIVIVLGILGIAPVWLAVAADVGTMIICVADSAMLLRYSWQQE